MVDEARKLVEAGFEYVTEIDNAKGVRGSAQTIALECLNSRANCFLDKANRTKAERRKKASFTEIPDYVDRSKTY